MPGAGTAAVEVLRCPIGPHTAEGERKLIKHFVEDHLLSPDEAKRRAREVAEDPTMHERPAPERSTLVVVKPGARRADGGVYRPEGVDVPPPDVRVTAPTGGSAVKKPETSAQPSTRKKAAMPDTRCVHCQRKNARYPSSHAPACPLRKGAKKRAKRSGKIRAPRDTGWERGKRKTMGTEIRELADKALTGKCGFCHRPKNDHTPSCPRAVKHPMGRPTGIPQARGIVDRIRALLAQREQIDRELGEIQAALDLGKGGKSADRAMRLRD